MDMNVINSNGGKEAAVMVKNAYKRFNVANVVLRGLNMTVPEGTVYVEIFQISIFQLD